MASELDDQSRLGAAQDAADPLASRSRPRQVPVGSRPRSPSDGSPAPSAPQSRPGT